MISTELLPFRRPPASESASLKEEKEEEEECDLLTISSWQTAASFSHWLLYSLSLAPQELRSANTCPSFNNNQLMTFCSCLSVTIKVHLQATPIISYLPSRSVWFSGATLKVRPWVFSYTDLWSCADGLYSCSHHCTPTFDLALDPDSHHLHRVEVGRLNRQDRGPWRSEDHHQQVGVGVVMGNSPVVMGVSPADR